MKKQEKRLKLVLKKETIARLNNFGMQRIYGGDGEIKPTDACVTKNDSCQCNELASEIGLCPL